MVLGGAHLYLACFYCMFAIPLKLGQCNDNHWTFDTLTALPGVPTLRYNHHERSAPYKAPSHSQYQSHLSISLTNIINMLKDKGKAIFSVGTELKRLISNLISNPSAKAICFLLICIFHTILARLFITKLQSHYCFYYAQYWL